MDATQTKILAVIVAFLLIVLTSWAIYKQIQEHYSKDDPKLKELTKVFEDFFNQERYWAAPLDMLNNRNIMDEITMYRGNKSYTINKEKVYICLKDENGQYYNDNMLLYVISHEAAHCLCPEIGHTELFHTIFEALLLELTAAGIYNPSIPIQQDYCQNGDPEM
jgi:hypothetical protein